METAKRQAEEAKQEVETAKKEVQMADRKVEMAERKVEMADKKVEMAKQEVEKVKQDIKKADKKVEKARKEEDVEGLQRAKKNLEHLEEDLIVVREDLIVAKKDLTVAKNYLDLQLQLLSSSAEVLCSIQSIYVQLANKGMKKEDFDGTLHPARSSLEGSMEQMSITTDGIKREMHSVQGTVLEESIEQTTDGTKKETHSSVLVEQLTFNFEELKVRLQLTLLSNINKRRRSVAILSDIIAKFPQTVRCQLVAKYSRIVRNVQEDKHRTYAVFPMRQSLNQSSLTRRKLSQSKSLSNDYQHSMLPKQDSDTSHDYLSFPCPPKLSGDHKTLEDVFRSCITDENCLSFIKTVSQSLGNNEVNAYCMFGLQHITGIDLNCWTYETEFDLYKMLPQVCVKTRFRADNCIGIPLSQNQAFISVQNVFISDAPKNCSICSKILHATPDTVGFYKMMGGAHSIPVLSNEIFSKVTSTDSGSFRATLQKCALGCYETFRVARNFDRAVKEWSGFVFPSQTKSCPVTKVTVKPDDDFGIAYKADYKIIELDDVGKEIQTTYESQKEIMNKAACFVSQNSSFNYVLRLSEEEVTECGKQFCMDLGQNQFICLQTASAFAYVFFLYLTDSKKALYLKHLISSDQRRALTNVEEDFRNKADRCSFALPVCLSENIVSLGKYSFHCYQALPDPLKASEARQCLQEFVKLVSESLMVLHNNYFMAHIDVRLENICFVNSHTEKQSTAIFIDLDRCCNADFIVSDVWFNSKTPSALYKQGLKNAQIDWRQLGCTVYWILKSTSTGNKVKSIHDLKVTDRKELEEDLELCGLDCSKSRAFVLQLIDEGVCKCDDFHQLFSDSRFTTPIHKIRQLQ